MRVHLILAAAMIALALPISAGAQPLVTVQPVDELDDPRRGFWQWDASRVRDLKLFSNVQALLGRIDPRDMLNRQQDVDGAARFFAPVQSTDTLSQSYRIAPQAVGGTGESVSDAGFGDATGLNIPFGLVFGREHIPDAISEGEEELYKRDFRAGMTIESPDGSTFYGLAIPEDDLGGETSFDRIRGVLQMEFRF